MAPIANPFNVDAATASEYELVRLPPQGGSLIGAFCGAVDSVSAWDERGVCVLKARKGFGKSHLLQIRSLRHRSSAPGSRTLFYPHGGHPRLLVDALSSLHVVVPRWLQGRESIGVWVDVWQLAILGLLAWITRARVAGLRGYSDWFGSLEALDQVHLDNRLDAQDRSQPNAMLTWFMGRVLERLEGMEFKVGSDDLKHGLYHGGTEWAIAIKANLESSGKTRIAMYLDAPDELVALDQPALWRNVQQGLLLAIWKFAKSSAWSRTLNIYATVRSEAFGSGHDHPDISQALGLAIPLTYGDAELEAMVNDRIRQADPAAFALPLTGTTTPLQALCGFETVVHEDRKCGDDGRFTESIFDSILRHTRRVPRELVAIVGAI